MGQMNLLKASVRGKLGELYGTETHGQAIIRAIPFSHAPHNERQTNAVRAFECVNRIAGGLAKHFWYYLDLSDRKMLKHNAVAQWLQPLLIGGVFNLQALHTLVRDAGTTNIQAATVNTETGAYALEVGMSSLPSPSADAQGAVLLVDQNGKVIFGSGFSGASYSKAGLARLDASLTYWCLLFRSDKQNGKWFPNSFLVQQCTDSGV